MDDGFFITLAEFLDQWRWPLVVGAVVLFLRQMVGVERDRRVFSLIMMAYFFLIIVAFWILKPLKKALFVAYYKANSLHLFGLQFEAAQVELLAKELNVLVAALAVIILAWVSRRVRGVGYAMSVSGFYVLCLVLFILSQPVSGGAPYVWLLYLFGDLFVISLVAIFFSYLHDHSCVASSRRAYGFVGLGGVVGGVVGSASATGVSQAFGVGGALATSALLLLCVCGLQYLAHRCAPGRAVADPGVSTTRVPVERDHGARALLHGLRIVLKSRYLMMIAGVLFLYELTSVLMDFQFTMAVTRHVDPADFKAYFGAVYTFSNVVALTVQLLLTTWLLRTYGPQAALWVMPLIMLAASGAYLAMPVLLFASLLNTADSGFAYSIQQTAKEALYVPTARDEKFEAKAFIDIVWLRLAKGVAVLLGLALSLVPSGGTTLISLSILVILLVWLLLVRRMTSGYLRLTRRSSRPPPVDAFGHQHPA